MNTFLTFIITACCFVIGALSPILNHPLLSPIYVVPISLAAIVFLTVAKCVKRPVFNPAIKRSPVLMWLTLGLLSFECVACTGITSGLTGQTPASTPVKRYGGTRVLIATRDLTRAETSPPTEVWGLYNVGAVARATQQVTDSGK